MNNFSYSSGISESFYGTKMHIISDNSGLFMIGFSTTTTICKYLHSTGVSQCQKIASFISYAFGQLMLSDNTFFFLAYDGASLYSLHSVKITYGSTSTDWANR